MKTFKADYSKGINAVTDRRMIPDGYAAIIDNADLRGGTPRCVRAPEFEWEVPVGTKTIYEFRNRWYYSTTIRTYASEYVGAQERVYYCEEDYVNDGIPQKLVNGVQADLGTLVPLAAPTVQASTSVMPTNITVTASTTGGSLSGGTYYYRVASIVNGYVQTASTEIIANLVAANPDPKTGSIALSWAAVDGVDGYVVYGRTSGTEREMARYSSTITTYTDDGSTTPSGSYASAYDAANALTYFYTYKRSVSTMDDEGGPSPVSAQIESSAGRTVTRNPLTDGYFEGAGSLSNIASAASSISLTLDSIATSGSLTYIGLTTAPDQDVWVSGLKLQIMDDSNAIYSDKSYVFTYPTAVADTTNLSVSIASSATGLSAGTYDWAVCAYRPSINITTVPDILESQVLSATSTVTVNWTSSTGAIGYIVFRKLHSASTWTRVATLTGQHSTYVDSGASEATGLALPTANVTGNVSATEKGSKVLLVSSYLDATTPTYTKIMLCYTVFSAGTTLVDGSAVYITGCAQAALNGLQTVINPDSLTTFAVGVWTAYSDTATTITTSGSRSGYKYWTLYRAGDSGTEWAKVADIPIGESTFNDFVSTSDLGPGPDSYYTDSGGNSIVFQMPPENANSPAIYNGMVFAISGNSVCWTPTGRPDAWPDAYRVSFETPPLKLASFSGSMVVFCENGVWRLDGQDPWDISRHKTKADGCVAPNTVTAVGSYLLYLAMRGVMLYGGNDALCLTENVLPYRSLLQPSVFVGGYTQPNFWWYPTSLTSQYGVVLAGNYNPIPGEDGFATYIDDSMPIDGVNYDARAFGWQNKYYLYYPSSAGNYQANTCWCIDLAHPNKPVTTLGIKPDDAWVDGRGEAHVLLANSTPADRTNLDAFIGAQTQFTSSISTTASANYGLYKFSPVGGERIPLRIRTAENACGSPQARKRFREVIIHGDGTCKARVYVDGNLVTFANGATYVNIDCTDNPSHPRRVLLPIGSWGYAISAEIIGLIDLRLIEFGFDPIGGEE